MKFLNLNTGYSFDGLWTDTSSKGYIFWFPEEQSTNIIHTMPIAIVCDGPAGLNISVEPNDVFKLVSHNNTDITIDGFTFNTPVFTDSLLVYPEPINDGNTYVAVFNVSCNSKETGEFIGRVNIGDAGYIKVGADIYGEYEPAYINLSNMGVEIPETVQKAIYTTNVHEDFKNNILINRKFKELLSNYWEIVANRGSYKSLINSLEWFEWDDSLKIKEIRKQNICGITKFDDKDIVTILENKILEDFTTFAKTTYVSLYCSLYNEIPEEYDAEGNPMLEVAVLKWSRNDIQLKLSLLAQFFGTFFLPIHMSILHATAEAKVFTNTIKAIYGATACRNDEFNEFSNVECNVPSNAVYKITNVNTQATERTVFVPKYDVHYTDMPFSFGVDKYPLNDGKAIKDFRIYNDQFYSGPGVIIPIELTIDNQTNRDFIKQTNITYTTGGDAKLNTVTFYDRFYASKKKFNIDFNFLAKAAGEYIMLFTFITGSGKTFNKTVKFVVEDTDDVTINIYRVKAKDDSLGFTYEDFADTKAAKYMFRIQPQDGEIPSVHEVIETEERLREYRNAFQDKHYTRHLPYMDPSNSLYDCKCYNYTGIRLTRTVVINVGPTSRKQNSNLEIQTMRGLMDNNFLEFVKYDETDSPVYYTYVSKKFYAELPAEVNTDKYDIIRDDLGFYPQFHELELIKGDTLDDYTFSQYDALCCAVEINVTPVKKDVFRYGHLIKNAEWTFTNSTNNKEVVYPKSSRVPFIADTKQAMKPGFYDIKFRYSLTDGIEREYSRNSAFRIKYIDEQNK